MRLRDVFLVSLYVLFAEATMLLVVGEGQAFPQALGFPLLVVALILVDRRRTIRVPTWGLNAAAAIGCTPRAVLRRRPARGRRGRSLRRRSRSSRRPTKSSRAAAGHRRGPRREPHPRAA